MVPPRIRMAYCFALNSEILQFTCWNGIRPRTKLAEDTKVKVLKVTLQKAKL